MSRYRKEQGKILAADLFVQPILEDEKSETNKIGRIDFKTNKNYTDVTIFYNCKGSEYSPASSKWKKLLVVVHQDRPLPASWNRHYVGKWSENPSWDWFAHVPMYKVGNYLRKYEGERIETVKAK